MQAEAVCPLCGQANACAAAPPDTRTEDCWCQSEPAFPQAVLEIISPEARGKRCICRACAAKALADTNS